ncbi:MAG: hypothetical protein J7L88_02855 [Thermoplasmata archaeon]|nr:hypothetical protein [Thermoplasmata archaeon]
MPMNVLGEVPFTEEELFRFKVSVEEGQWRRAEDRGALIVRVPGESVDVVSVLEDLSERMGVEEVEGLQTVVIISDYEVMSAKIEGLRSAIERALERDREVADELRAAGIPPWEKYIFTVETDPLQRKRCGIIIPGFWKDVERGLIKVPENLLPSDDVEIYYVVTQDLFKKMRRGEFMEFVMRYRAEEEVVFEEVEGEAEEVVYGDPQEVLQSYGFMLDPNLSRPSEGIYTMRRGGVEIVLLEKERGEGERLMKRILKRRRNSYVVLLADGLTVGRGLRSLTAPPGDIVSLEKFVKEVLK